MITNCVLTIYKRIRGKDGDSFTRVLKKAWYHREITETLSKEGMKAGTNITNIARIRIPDITVDISEGDLVLKGIGPEITSVKDVPEHHVVISARVNDYGLNPHISVKAI